MRQRRKTLAVLEYEQPRQSLAGSILRFFIGGDDQTRTDYLYVANVSLYRVSYIPASVLLIVLYMEIENFSIVFMLFSKNFFLFFGIRSYAFPLPPAE